MKSIDEREFNWNRYPSREGVSRVFFANSDEYTEYGNDITKAELTHMLWVHNNMNDMESKRKFHQMLVYIALASLPFFYVILTMRK
jgi:hypothetical protein